jgi:hypothetical protein
MAQTVGTRAGEKHRGDFLVTCAYCGAVWYRSVCRRNAAGQLICPDDQHIRDPVTLSRLIAARTTRPLRRRVDGGNVDREALTTAGPLVVCPELVVAGWDAGAITGVGDGGRVVSLPSAIAGVSALSNLATVEQPFLMRNAGRQYVSFRGAHRLEAALSRPAPASEPTFYWAIARRSRWTELGFWWSFFADALPNLSVVNFAEPWVVQVNGAATVNQIDPSTEFKRVEASFTGMSSDYLKIGRTTVADGVTAGNNAPAGAFWVGAGDDDGDLIAAAYLDLGELWVLRGVPSTEQTERLNDYGRAKWGSAVLL